MKAQKNTSFENQDSNKTSSKSKNSNNLDLPDPIAPNYLNRSLIDPWRRTNLLECTETQIPLNQIWTQIHQQMFELQEIARKRGVPPNYSSGFSSPYPQ